VYDPGNKSNLSNHNRSGEDFESDTEDTSTRDNIDNTSSDDNSGDNADSSSDDEYTIYDPGGIGTSSTFSDATQTSTTNNITDNSSLSLTRTLFPFDHDAANHINTRSDTNSLGNATSLDISISSSARDHTPTRDDDDSTDSYCNSSSSLLSLRAPHLLISTANLIHNSHSDDHKLMFNPGGHPFIYDK